jgi:hypothetical protein
MGTSQRLPFTGAINQVSKNVLTTGLGCNSLNDPAGPIIAVLVIHALQRRDRDTEGDARVSKQIVTEIDTDM